MDFYHLNYYHWLNLNLIGFCQSIRKVIVWMMGTYRVGGIKNAKDPGHALEKCDTEIIIPVYLNG